MWRSLAQSDSLLPARLAGRMAAILYAGLGVLALTDVLLSDHTQAGRSALALTSVALLALGSAWWLLPWNRWPRRALLALVPLSFAMLILVNLTVPIDPYRYDLALFALFAWIGLACGRGVATAALPLLILTYLLPLDVVRHASRRDALSAVVAVAIFCVALGEGLAWLVAHLTKIQGALEQSEGRFRALSEQATDVISVVDGRGRFTYVSPSVSTIMGYDPPALLGSSFLDLLHPDDRVTAEAHLGRGGATPVALRIRHADGAWRWLEHTTRDARGDPLIGGVVATSRDVTARRMAEEALRASEQRFRTLVEEAPIAVMITDAEGRLETVNPALCALTGYAASELIGKSFTVALPPEQRDAFTRLYAERFARDARVEDEYEVPSRDGRMLTLLSAAVPLTDLAGRPRRAAFLIDISERKRTERAREEAMATVQEMARLRSDFVAAVSHELRTPLTAILGFAELLQAHWERMSDPARRGQIKRIWLAANRQRHLVEDLLLLTELAGERPPVQVRPVSLPQAVRRAAAELQGSYTDQPIDLHGAHHLDVMADPHRLIQVLANLLDNAAKYSPEGSAIDVTWERDGAAALVRVRDRGPGIAAEGRDRLFTRFGRVPGSPIRSGRVGTGLGLYLSRQLAEAMAGSLDLEATGPDGSTFALRLPPAILE